MGAPSGAEGQLELGRRLGRMARLGEDSPRWRAFRIPRPATRRHILVDGCPRHPNGEPFVGTEVPIKLRSSDGDERQIYMNGIYQPFRGPDGKIEGVIAFAYEVTDLVVSRQQVEALAEDLKKAVRVRDDFLSIAGHELKTPLAALTLQIEGLQRQAEKGSLAGAPPRLVERLEKAVGHIGRLDRLVAELLDVSRITAGRMTLQLEEVDLTVVLSDVGAGSAFTVDLPLRPPEASA